GGATGGGAGQGPPGFGPPRHLASRSEQERPDPAGAVRIGFLQQPAGAEALDEHVLGRVVHFLRSGNPPPAGGQIRGDDRSINSSEPLAGRGVSARGIADHGPAGDLGRRHVYGFTSRGGGASSPAAKLGSRYGFFFSYRASRFRASGPYRFSKAGKERAFFWCSIALSKSPVSAQAAAKVSKNTAFFHSVSSHARVAWSTARLPSRTPCGPVARICARELFGSAIFGLRRIASL